MSEAGTRAIFKSVDTVVKPGEVRRFDWTLKADGSVHWHYRVEWGGVGCVDDSWDGTAADLRLACQTALDGQRQTGSYQLRLPGCQHENFSNDSIMLDEVQPTASVQEGRFWVHAGTLRQMIVDIDAALQ